MHAADVGAAELEPLGRKATATAGDPHEACLVLYEDDLVETGVWECTPGEFPSRWADISETFHVTAGAGTLTDDAGRVHALRPGVVVTVPRGATGSWHIRETIRKSYVITKAG
jgi:uncharacterized cupin superfamily protein